MRNEMKFTFKKEEVLNKLRENREEHISLVQKAQKGHREKFKEMLLERIEQIDAGEPVSTQFDLYVPENHVTDYDRVIEMLEMATEDEIELDDVQFQAYVRGKWSWEHHWLAANSVYSREVGDTFQTKYGG